MLGRHRFGPHRLPDAGGPVVPDAVGLELPVLLPPGLGGVVGVVLGPDHQDVLVVRVAAEQVGHLDGERCLAADVLADEDPVEPHSRLVVDSTEVDQAELAGCRAEVAFGDGAAVPDDGVEAGVVDPRGGRLRWERHLDLAVERSPPGRVVPAFPQAAALIVVGEPPRTVQADPGRPGQLRPRVAAVLQ